MCCHPAQVMLGVGTLRIALYHSILLNAHLARPPISSPCLSSKSLTCTGSVSSHPSPALSQAGLAPLHLILLSKGVLWQGSDLYPCSMAAHRFHVLAYEVGLGLGSSPPAQRAPDSATPGCGSHQVPASTSSSAAAAAQSACICAQPSISKGAWQLGTELWS
jgi:hypothetical protein